MPKPVDDVIWLTSAAHAALVAELEQLTRSSSAPPPHVETRIRELKRVLRPGR